MMPDLLHMLVAISTAAGNVLLTGIWQGALLVVCVALGLQLLPRVTAASRFAVWSSAFLVLVLLPALHFTPASGPQASSPSAPLFQVDVRWSFAIAAAWGILSAFRLVRLATNAVRLRKLWREVTPIALPREVVEPAGSRKVQVFTSALVDRPSVIGFFSPRILIPAWLIDKLSAEELQQIVLHEREHLRRADDWLNLLQKVALAVFPLNPVLLWIEKRLCFERELACDDGVLRATRAPHAYASCLTNLAERALDRRTTSLSLGAWERRPALARRVFRILLGEKAVSPKLSHRLTAALVSALALGAAGLSRCPELVSFSSPSELHTSTEARVQPSVPVTSPGKAQYQNVSFHESPDQRPKFTNAALVSYRGPSETVPARRILKKLHRTAGVKLHRAKTPRSERPAAPGDWMILTSWEGSYTPTVVLAVMTYAPDSPSSSLPANAGWIFFQL